MGARSLVLASLLAGPSSVALAQSPGEYAADGSGAPGNVSPQPMVAQPCGSCRNVMATRWAVGLSIGSFGVMPDNSPNTTASQFNIGELAVRFRATPHLELELQMGGGAQQLADGTQTDVQVAMVGLGARYRFAIHSDWNGWIMGGLGQAVIGSANATQDQMGQDTRLMVEGGVGLERRFDHFALQAELRMIGLGVTKAERTGGTPVPVMYPSGTPGVPTSGADTLSGGSLTLGASYYF